MADNNSATTAIVAIIAIIVIIALGFIVLRVLPGADMDGGSNIDVDLNGGSVPNMPE